jgi:glycine hydroxymethyltransferase
MLDIEMKTLLEEERDRQKTNITLIASENYVSDDVREAVASVLMNKYSEGYPGKRYYRGQAVSDKVEILCQNRALELFDLSAEEWAVNVQPLSGSPANVAVYNALLSPGSKIMGMSLDHGGHLTHGHKVSITGKIWEQIPYGVDESTEVLDYDALEELAKKEKPDLIVAGYTAYPREIDFKKFRKICDKVGAYLMVDMSHVAGLIAGEVYNSPFPYADVVTTTTHKTLRGPRSGMIFSRRDDRKLHLKINKSVFPGLQGGPHMNQIAGVSVALAEASTKEFKKYAKQIILNAQALADELSNLGWRVISGGTDSHLILVDVWMGGEGLSGDEASIRLEEAGIVVNKNSIPNETRSPMDPSGIRLGTAAETTRGLKEEDFRGIARQIDGILK